MLAYITHQLATVLVTFQQHITTAYDSK